MTPLPRSLYGRVALILFGGLVAAHALSLWLILRAQGETALTMMLNYLPKDVAASVAILDRVPAAERPEWLPRVARRNYTYRLGDAERGTPIGSSRVRTVVAAIADALGPAYPVDASVSPSDPSGRVSLQLRLHDGSPLTVELAPPPLAISRGVVLILVLQLAALALVTWLAVRLATRPVSQLAEAADALGPELTGRPLREDGPIEVARAGAAFNAMQRRIKEHLAERLQILAAISHDLQTPLARLALRADLLDDAELRDKIQHDVRAMELLVQQGIAYARSANGSVEPARRIDLHALLDSLVCDYADAGAAVRLEGRWTAPVTTRPETLRRIIVNLVDNALKFGDDVAIAVEAEATSRIGIVVRDRGPGIPAHELITVLQPFYRLEGSRSRETGGSGLGLAIAQQLTGALGGTLTLANREGGGLAARVSFPTGS